MARHLSQDGGAGLERSCAAPHGDWLRIAPAVPGLERFEARFAGGGYAPHRHDVYAIGITLQGVQRFRYRGAAAQCLAGQVYVLHPDELHDGHAGTEAGFRYRGIYIAPDLVRDALGQPGWALPFYAAVVSDDRRLAAAVLPALDDLDRPLDDLQRDQIVIDIADALAAGASSPPRHALAARHGNAVAAARDLIEAGLRDGVTSEQLEAATGHDRYTLARQFRACFGTSPYRYLMLRRLDRARRLIAHGLPLAEAAVAAGFADQSHLTRRFKQAYGLTPARWAALRRG
ncbi:AraC family transcriptional regulator [Desertibaculum subflavum]|uniref:AraC family transcriptional regulator n=1 Tax=Desertibaculum subflavum TaxID=2268458 RepID=UPI000E663ECD